MPRQDVIDAANALCAEARAKKLAAEQIAACIWCAGTGFISSTGVMCRTCHGTGKPFCSDARARHHLDSAAPQPCCPTGARTGVLLPELCGECEFEARNRALPPEEQRD